MMKIHAMKILGNNDKINRKVSDEIDHLEVEILSHSVIFSSSL